MASTDSDVSLKLSANTQRFRLTSGRTTRVTFQGTTGQKPPGKSFFVILPVDPAMARREHLQLQADGTQTLMAREVPAELLPDRSLPTVVFEDVQAGETYSLQLQLEGNHLLSVLDAVPYDELITMDRGLRSVLAHSVDLGAIKRRSGTYPGPYRRFDQLDGIRSAAKGVRELVADIPPARLMRPQARGND